MGKKTKEAKSENTTSTSYADIGFDTKMAEKKALYELWQKGEYKKCMDERKYGIDFELALT